MIKLIITEIHCHNGTYLFYDKGKIKNKVNLVIEFLKEHHHLIISYSNYPKNVVKKIRKHWLKAKQSGYTNVISMPCACLLTL